jgi:hypothetical protein
MILIVIMMVVAVAAIVTIMQAGKFLYDQKIEAGKPYPVPSMPPFFVEQTLYMHRIKRVFHISHDLLDSYRGSRTALIENQVMVNARKLGEDLLHGGFIEVQKRDDYLTGPGPVRVIELEVKAYK